MATRGHAPKQITWIICRVLYVVALVIDGGHTSMQTAEGPGL
jgi:hypothetical protein